MPRETLHDLTGLLLANGHYPVLRADDGGEWRLDVGGGFRHLLGLRVRVQGRRADFDMIDVELIEPA